MHQVERTFGEYLPGMREAVATVLQRVDERLLEQLYKKILREHEDHWPPAAAKLRRFLAELNSQPPQVGLLPAPLMCHEERAAGMRQILEKLAKKRMGATISEGVSPPLAPDGGANTASTSPAPFFKSSARRE